MDVLGHVAGGVALNQRGVVLGHRLVDDRGELVDGQVARQRIGEVGRPAAVGPMTAGAVGDIDLPA